MIDRSVTYQLDCRPLGKWQKQLKKGKRWRLRGVGKTLLILDLVLFLMGSTSSENTRLRRRGEEKQIPFMLLKISGAHTKVTSKRATAGISVLFAIIQTLPLSVSLTHAHTHFSQLACDAPVI